MSKPPPPHFTDEVPDYGLEEMIQIAHLEGELDRLLEQILSIDPNGMMRIHQSIQRAGSAVATTRAKALALPDSGLH